MPRHQGPQNRQHALALGEAPTAWTGFARNPYGSMYRSAPSRHVIPIRLDHDPESYVAAFERLNHMVPTKLQPQGASAGRRLEVAP